jgi:hypothetical protein
LAQRNLVLDNTYTLNFGSFLLIIQNKYSKIIFFNSLKNAVKENQDCRSQLRNAQVSEADTVMKKLKTLLLRSKIL